MNVKNIVLGFGIFIVFLFLLHNGIRAFYPAPDYNTFCNSTTLYPQKIPAVDVNCTLPSSLSIQQEQCYSDRGQPVYSYNEQNCITGLKECNYCQKNFDDASKSYNRIVFIIALIVGIIALLTGYTILSIEPVDSALMASGIGSIIYGTASNWENLGNMGRFILLLFSLIILIWIALRINKKKK